MKLREIGYRGKTAVIAGASTAMFGGSEVALRNGEQTDLLETLNWFGKAGLFWAGIRVVKIGADKMGESLAKDREANWNDVLGRLPDLKDPVSPLRITTAVQRRMENKPYVTGLTTAFSWTRRASESGVNENDYLAYYSLAEDVDYVIGQMAEAVGTPSAEPNDFRYLLANNSARILDEVAPIRDDCTKTPQPDDTGKCWYDYIHHQAFDRAGILFENQ